MSKEISTNIISQTGRAILEKRLVQIQEELRRANLAVGEAGGTNDWHDNPTLEDVRRQIDLLEIALSKTEVALYNYKPITPRNEIESVGVGNQIELQYEREEHTETYNLLGPIDASLNKNNCISFESPLGMALIGARKGQTVEVDAPEQIIHVTVVNIRPGNFK
jgi:transcription elongation factor GreA